MSSKIVTLEQLQNELTSTLSRIRDFMDSEIGELELDVSTQLGDKFDDAYVQNGYLYLCKGEQQLRLGPFSGGGETYDDTELRGRIEDIEEQESTWSAKYTKPSSGIPKTDLASAVQTSLGKADRALQEHQDISGKQDKSTLEADVAAKGFTKNTGTYSKPSGGIPKTDLASAVQTSLSRADSALQAHQSLDGYATEQWVDNKGYLTEHQSLVAYRTAAAQDIIDGGKVDKVTGKGLSTNDYTNADKAKVDGALTSDDTEEAEAIELADVAISGSYNDLSNRPTIPTVNDAVLTIKQGGVTKGTFSANASTATTISLEAGSGESYDDTELRERIEGIEGKEASWDAKYSKPSTGIPATDLASGVLPTFRIDPEEGIYQINMHDLSARYDYNANEITATYARKSEIPSLTGYATESYVNAHHDTTKQDNITDLATIRSGAALGATAVQTDDLDDYALKSELPTKTSDLANDSGYIVKTDIIDEEEILVPAYTNLVDTAGYTDGKLLSSNGAEGDSASQFVTGFIPITKGNVVRFKPHDNIYADSCVVVFYDAQKTVTAGIGKTFGSILGNATYGSPTITDNTFTLNTANSTYYFWSNIAYVRFCGNGGGAGAIVTIDEEISGSATETKYTLKDEIKVTEDNLDFNFPPLLNGRNIVCFGDSILALIRNETGVLAQAAKMTGGNFINCGFGGCRMSQHPESKYDAFSFYQLANAVATNNFSAQDIAAIATGVPDYYPEQLARLKAVNWNNVDEIIVAYGTNDYDANVVIDGSTNSTIIGALKNGLTAILTAYPHLKVNIASTIFRMWGTAGSDTHTNSNDDKLPDVNNALKNVAAERKANFIDLYNTCGITTDNASTMLSDGTHPSAVGCKIIGRVYGGSIIKPTGANYLTLDTLPIYDGSVR